MNELFKKTSIWQMAFVYIIANLLNLGVVIIIKQFVPLPQAVVDALMQGTMFLFIVLWFVVLIVKNNISVLPEIKGIKGLINPKEFSLVLIFNYAVSLAVVFGILTAASLFIGQESESTMMATGATQVKTNLSVLVHFVAAVVLAPIAEEFMFRGILLNRLIQKLPITAAVIISSVAFGATHLTLATLGSTIFGICMCVLYLKSNNIFVPISMHILNNFILSVLENFPLKGIINMELTITVAVIGFIICFIITTLAGTCLARRFQFFNIKRHQLNKQTAGGYRE